MALLPGPNSDWLPLSPSQAIVGASSTALTVPNPATQTPPVRNSGNMVVAAFLIPQNAAYWVRSDGSTATNSATGGSLKLNVGDYQIVYGLPALLKIRVIQDAAGGGLLVNYYLYRNQPVGP